MKKEPCEKPQRQKLYCQYIESVRGKLPRLHELGEIKGFIGELNNEDETTKEISGTHIYFSEINGWGLNPTSLIHPELATFRTIEKNDVVNYSNLEYFYPYSNIGILKPLSLGEVIVMLHEFSCLEEIISKLPSIEMLGYHAESLENLKKVLKSRYFLYSF
jgi:hypothetical protein